MRKDIKTNKVVKALALGLAATMAMTQPISVMAESAPVDSNDDAEGVAGVEKAEMAKAEASTICDGAQEAVENAQEVVAVVPESEEVVADLNSIDGKLDETEMDIVLANATNAAADKMVDETKKAELEAGAIADEMQAIVDDTDRIVDEKIDDIKTATSIADANAANAELVAAVEAAEEKLANRTAAYDAAVAAYDKAVAEVKALEEAYDKAVADATEDAAAAAEKLEVAKQKALALADEAKLAQEKAESAKADAEKEKADALAKLEAADKALAEAEKAQQEATDAKVAVDEAVQSGLTIAEKEALTSEDTGLVWKNQDELFKAIMEEYYLPEVAGVTGATVTRVQGADNDSMNYFEVKYVNAAGEEVVVYYNYKMDKDENGVESKDKIVIFKKRPVEVNGDPAVNPDQYVDEGGNVIALEDIENYINVDGTYYEANGATGSATLVESSVITGTSTTDVTVSETKTETYKVTEDGTLVKEVTADVTTVTYTGATFTSDVEYATDEERDAAAAAKKDELEKATGKDATVTETSETTYTATGTYIPVFTQTVTVNKEYEFIGSGDKAIDKAEDEVVENNGFRNDTWFQNDLEDEGYYLLGSVEYDLSAEMTDDNKERIIDLADDYRVTGTATATYAKITKESVGLNTLRAILSVLGLSDSKENVEAAAKAYVESTGGIWLERFNWLDGDLYTAEIAYIKGYKVETEAYASQEEAEAALAEAIANGVASATEPERKNANGEIARVAYGTSSDVTSTTTYSYAVNYLEKTGENTESKVVATETYGKAEVLTGQIIQNKNYVDDNIDLTQDDEAYRAFVDTAVQTNTDAIAALEKATAELEDARKLTQEAKDNHIAANEKFDAAEAELAAAQKLIADSVAAAEAVLAAQEEVEKLQVAIAAMEGAGSNAEDLENLAADLKAAEDAKAAAEKAFEEVQERLDDALEELAKTIDRLTPDPDDDDDDDEEVVVETPVVAAAPAPVAVQPVVQVVDEPVVEIDEMDIPLAEEIEDADATEDDDTVVIDEEEVPLAAAPIDGEDGMSWWWLLVVVVLGATGYEMYRRHKNKKAKAVEKKEN